MSFQPSTRNRTNIQFAELRAVVDQKFESLHDELSDCYYNFWRIGLPKPFITGVKIYNMGLTPAESKLLFDKLHGLIFHLRDIAFHAENLKQPGNKRIAVALYNEVTDESGAVIDTVSARAQRLIDALKAEGVEITVT